MKILPPFQQVDNIIPKKSSRSVEAWTTWMKKTSVDTRDTTSGGNTTSLEMGILLITLRCCYGVLIFLSLAVTSDLHVSTECPVSALGDTREEELKRDSSYNEVVIDTNQNNR